MAVKSQEPLYRPKTMVDVLSFPLIGRFLKWRHGRLALQIPFLLIALLLIYDGFTGPDRAAENLATVIPWVHYRGVLVLAVIVAGNFFCMACPFTLPRTLAKRFSLVERRFPKRLRNKWVAVISLLVLFFLYEWLDIWASPALTVWLIIAYFILSFVIEASFGESAFCKYICPLGSFNYVYSTASPTQITSKNLDICRQCVGKECVNGSYSPTPIIRIDEIKGGDAQIIHNAQGTPGCGTQLFVPQIQSNLDCMMCLDCVRACPHDNVALMIRAPGRELFNPDAWAKRWDIAFLVVSLTCFSVVNAFGMIPPVYDLMQRLATGLGLVSAGLSDMAIEAIVLVIIFVTGGILLPAVILVGAAWLSQTLTNSRKKHELRHIATGFAPAFVPLGLGVWFGHYGFHFLVGALSIIPVFQNFLIDHRIYLLGTEANWDIARIIPDNSTIGLIQVAALIGGFFGSMLVAQRVSSRLYRRDAPMGLLPWALVLLALMLAAVAIFSQPMEMRGTILFS